MNESDDIDRANELAQRITDAALEEVQRRAAPERRPVGATAAHSECEDCGDDIPPERLTLGKIRCVYCQRVLEVRRAGR